MSGPSEGSGLVFAPLSLGFPVLLGPALVRFGRSGAALRFRFLLGIGYLAEKSPGNQTEHSDRSERHVDVIEVALPPRPGRIHSHAWKGKQCQHLNNANQFRDSTGRPIRFDHDGRSDS